MQCSNLWSGCEHHVSTPGSKVDSIPLEEAITPFMSLTVPRHASSMVSKALKTLRIAT